jgi:hypothetical protein
MISPRWEPESCSHRFSSKQHKSRYRIEMLLWHSPALGPAPESALAVEWQRPAAHLGARRSSFGALKGAGRRLRMERVGKPRGIRKPSSVE